MRIEPSGAGEVNAAFKTGGVEVSPLGVVAITTGVCVCYVATLAVLFFRGGSFAGSTTEFNVAVNPPAPARRTSEPVSEPLPVEAGD